MENNDPRAVRRRLNPIETERDLINALAAVIDAMRNDPPEDFMFFVDAINRVADRASALPIPVVQRHVRTALADGRSDYLLECVNWPTIDLNHVLSAMQEFQPSETRPFVPDNLSYHDFQIFQPLLRALPTVELDSATGQPTSVFFAKAKAGTPRQDFVPAVKALITKMSDIDVMRSFVAHGILQAFIAMRESDLAAWFIHGMLLNEFLNIDVDIQRIKGIINIMKTRFPNFDKTYLKNMEHMAEDIYFAEVAKQAIANNDADTWTQIVPILVDRESRRRGHFGATDLFQLIPVERGQELFEIPFLLFVYQNVINRRNIPYERIMEKVEAARNAAAEGEMPVYQRAFVRRPRRALEAFSVGPPIGPNLFDGLDPSTNRPLLIRSFTNREQYDHEMRTAEFINCKAGFQCIQGTLTKRGTDGVEYYLIAYPAMQPLAPPPNTPPQFKTALVWTLLRTILVMRSLQIAHGHLNHSLFMMRVTENDETIDVVVVGNLGNIHAVSNASEGASTVGVRVPSTAMEAVKDMKDAASAIQAYMPLEFEHNVGNRRRIQWALDTLTTTQNPFLVWHVWNMLMGYILEAEQHDTAFQDLANTFRLDKNALIDTEVKPTTISRAIVALQGFLPPGVREEFLQSVLTANTDSDGVLVVSQDAEQMVRDELRQQVAQGDVGQPPQEQFRCVNADMDVITGEPFSASHTMHNMVYVDMPVGTLRMVYCMSLTNDSIEYIRSSLDEGLVKMFVNQNIVKLPDTEFEALVAMLPATNHVLKVYLERVDGQTYHIENIE